MVPSIFSRRPADQHGEATSASPRSTRPTNTLGEALRHWRSELTGIIEEESAQTPTLVCTNAHPGGLAQLYTEHPTRLSLLIREPIALGRALDRARTILMRSEERAARYGIGPIHLSIGTATWVENDEVITVPALLRPVRLARRDDDVVIALSHGATLDARLAKALHEVGLDISGDDIVREATGPHGFSGSQAMEVLRRVARALPRFDIRDELVVGLFTHPARIFVDELISGGASLGAAPLVRALAGEKEATDSLSIPLPDANPGDRDPWGEKGIGDLTPNQQDVVEAVAQGRSFLVDAAPGEERTATVSAILADAAASGRSIVHVGGAISQSIATYTRLIEAGMGEAVASIDGYSDARYGLAERVEQAMNDTEPVMDRTDVDTMRARLRHVRSTLDAYVRALHEPYKQFGVSPAGALDALTDLMSTENPPLTRVRLDENTLYEIALDQGEEARRLLLEALESEVFTAHLGSAWKEAVIESDEVASDVLSRVNRLATTLPQLRLHISTIAGEAGIEPAATLAQWDRQLAMFDAIADVLDVFQPRIFEKSAADMVIATAPKQWRKDHGITMSRSEIRRLVKAAEDLVRPGVHVPDLHRALIRVQERREAWRALCGDDTWPILPARMSEVSALTNRVRDDVDAIAPVFAAEGDLVGTHLHRLTTLVEGWAADTSTARTLPARLEMRRHLNERGLLALAQDLATRAVEPSALDAELDLAWWASLLRSMMATHSALAGVDPSEMSDLVQEGRLLDEAQVASLVPQTLTQLRRTRVNAMAARENQYEELRDILSAEAPPSDLALVSNYALVRHLIPILMTVPGIVPSVCRLGHRVDTLILDGVAQLPMGEIIPLIARARQVVIIEDLASTGEDESVRNLLKVLPIAHIQGAPSRLNDQVALLLARYGYDHAGIPVPWTAASAPVSARWVEARGMPAPGVHAIESTATEVEAVIDTIVEHAVESPDRSLAVVALSDRHAQRIRTAVEQMRATSPGLEDFFDGTREEPFVILGPQEAPGVKRESVILSVGFAQTPHGRVIHDFGAMSTDEGADVLAGCLSSVRGDLTLISALHSEDIDRDRLTHEGAQMLVDLIEIAEGHAGEGMDAWPVLPGDPDRLLVDLADHLYSRGLEVVANVGIPGGMRVPLAIGHPDSSGRLLVAVCTDDEAYVAQPSQRVRDRVWPRWLESQGWKVYTALSMALFIDPEKEANGVVDAVLDALDELRAPTPAASAIEVPALVTDDTQLESEASQEDEDPQNSNGQNDPVGAEATSAAMTPVEEKAESVARPTMPLLDEDLDEESRRRRNTDEVTTGMLLAIQKKERGSEEGRGPRPAIAKGLPLAAYSDDQLDEMAAWVRSDGVERSDLETAEELRLALGITRRGFQSDAVLGNVVRRTKPVPNAETDEGAVGNPGENDE